MGDVVPFTESPHPTSQLNCGADDVVDHLLILSGAKCLREGSVEFRLEAWSCSRVRVVIQVAVFGRDVDVDERMLAVHLPSKDSAFINPDCEC